jgi:hypothetical protein
VTEPAALLAAESAAPAVPAAPAAESRADHPAGANRCDPAPLGPLDPAQSPWSALRVRQAIALALADLDDREEARRMLASCRQLARAGLASPLDQLRYLWTEAQILDRLGDQRRAFDLLRTVAGGLAQERQGCDAALVLLDAVELLPSLPHRPGELESLRVQAAKLAKLLPATPQLVFTLALRLIARGEVPAPPLLAYARDSLRATRRDPGRPPAPSRRPPSGDEA